MYTLKLGDYYLAPKFSIHVEESADFETLANTDSACGTCTLTGTREFTFKLHLLGSGSLASAWALQAQIQAQLSLACDETVLLRRRVQDEPWLEYRVTKGSLRMVDVINQYTCERILTLELKLTLVSTVNEIDVFYERGYFPKLPVSVINFFPPVEDPIEEAGQFPAPVDVLV